MAKRTTVIILGVLFGLYLMAFTYFSFVMGIVISLKLDIDLSFTIIAFPVLGLATIIGACFIKKHVWISRITFSISTVFYVAYQVFLFTSNIFSEFNFIMLIFITFALIGIAATIISFITKSKQLVNTEENQQQ